MAQAAGADIIDLNMGCPAKEVTGALSGSALMRDLDLAERLIAAAVNATSQPVTLKMRLGWDDASRNAPELAMRAERIGVQAITVHGRTRQQFYKGVADWRAVADVKAAVKIPVIVNGDIVDAETARAAREQSGADAVMIARGASGRPWIAKAIDDVLDIKRPGGRAGHGHAARHRARSFRGFRGLPRDLHGVRIFRKHLGWYVEDAAKNMPGDVRRAAKARLCQLNSPRDVERELIAFWRGIGLSEEIKAAA